MSSFCSALFYSFFIILINFNVKKFCPMDPPPIRPDESDCCGSGCRRCVFDVYEEEYKIWKNKAKRKNDGSRSEQLLQPDQYTDLVIAEIKDISKDTNHYILSGTPEKTINLCFKLGQHIFIRANIENESISRPFTPVQLEDDDKNVIHLIIKIYDQGKLSSVMKHWKVGDYVQCRGLLGDEIEYISNEWDALLLISAGTGITPMINIIKTILHNEEDDTLVILLYACQTYEDILLKYVLDSWTDHWNFKVVYFLSQENNDTASSKKRYKEEIICERIDKNALQTVLRNNDIDHAKSFSYICGPIDFEVDVKAHLEHCGLHPDNAYRF